MLLPNVITAATTDEKSTSSNVTVNVYVSMGLSTAFDSGVEFGNLDPASSDNNATTCNALGCNLTISSDTNIAVDIVMKVDANLTRYPNAETIPALNYTWNSTAGTSLQMLPGNVLNTTGYDYRTEFKVGDSVSAGGVRSWQAWLDIPGSQTAGTYNNTLFFCATQEDTTDC